MDCDAQLFEFRPVPRAPAEIVGEDAPDRFSFMSPRSVTSTEIRAASAPLRPHATASPAGWDRPPHPHAEDGELFKKLAHRIAEERVQ